jgi:glycosyltransferase involved in cell wall biosynthesis
LYSAIDVCVLCSLNEGTPVALIEAMAAEKPVVATRVGGVPDIVEHERTGLIVPARDAAALADAMIGLARDASRRIEMGRAGRCAVAGRFSAAGLVAAVNTLYAERLALKRGTIFDAK